MDGAVVGSGSWIGSLTVAPGQHELVLRHPSFPACTLRVELEPAAHETLSVSLWAKVAQLWIEVAPWAEIWVDGRHIDTTPLDRAVILRPGEHRLELRNPAYPPWRRTFRFEAGSRTRLRVSLATGRWELVQ